jgi:hypothetical protein
MHKKLTGTNAKLSPLFNLPKKVFLSTGFELTHEYTCLKNGMLKIALDIKQHPSCPIFSGRRCRKGENANTA